MNRSRPPGPRRIRRRLLAELLEQRLLLAAPIVVLNTQDSGPGSLRQAIIDADNSLALSTIDFNISPAASTYTINLQSSLPAISVPVLIDGTSQPGYGGAPIIEINGGNVSSADGLLLAAGSSGSIIQGLDILDFQTGAGIHIQSNDNTVLNNYLGTDLTGKSAGPGNTEGNYYGIFIDGGSGNTIGATGGGNLLSANQQAGLVMANGATPTSLASNNLVIDNEIGTDVTGSVALGNGFDGIELFASNNTIGGTGFGDLNVISGNSEWGIDIGVNQYVSNAAPAYDNLIEGNYIGTNLAGTGALGNGYDGVTDNNDSGNTIGGTAAGAGNVISASANDGISLNSVSDDLIAGNNIGTSPGSSTNPPASGFLRLGNGGDGIGLYSDSTVGSSNNTIGMPGVGNLVVNNGNDGINITSGSDDNLVSGNAVGTTLAPGTSIGIGPLANLGNTSYGIALSQSSGNTIGGVNTVSGTVVTQLDGNVSSGNGSSGIIIGGNDPSDPTGNLVIGNFLGTNADGSRAVANTEDGLTISGSSSNTVGGANTLNPDGSLATMAGNLLSGNLGNGLAISETASTGNLLEGNWIGTSLTGGVAIPDSVEGILIDGGASNNTIGAANLDGSSANLISGNAQSGIEIQGAGTTDNVVLGNRIGLTAGGFATLPNLGDGVLLNAASNIIGGTAQGAGNVISGNIGAGVEITNLLPPLDSTSADDNQILGNLIGVAPSGISTGVGNVESGIEIDNASSTTIGGVTASPGTGTGNIISGNRQNGIVLTGTTTATVIEGNIVGLDAAGTATQGNLLAGIDLDDVAGNTVGGSQTGAGNVLSSNGTAGLQIDQGSNNVVQGNLIGTDPSGTAVRGNLQNGLVILDSTDNTVGGTTAFAANIISGNNLSGVSISGASATGNIVLGNRIGTDVSGTISLGNGQNGVLIDSAVADTIGGSIAGAGNLISANRSSGIEIGGTTAAPAQLNVIAGNLIGTTADGSTALGNSQNGVFLTAGATSNTIGGTTPVARNVISANQTNGVELITGATGNVIAGNLIGTDSTGEFALGNNNVGVAIYDTSANTIGGLTATAGRSAANVISGNRSSGVLISGSTASGNTLQGNLIGTDISSLITLPNASTGVTLDNAPDNVIGGEQPGAGNVIAANRSFGVFVLGTTATGNRIAGNFIGTNSFGTANLGNALDGLVLNEAPDNTIGGLVFADRNVISGNGGNGINVANITGDDGVAILGNDIGTTPNGLGALPNAMAGVLINGVAGTIIAAGAQPNLISGNSSNGIYLLGAGASRTIVQGSLIGTNISGTAAIGNGGDGIAVENAPACTIGGTGAGQGNLISGNASDGIEVYGTTANGNALLNNVIGTNATATTALANGGYGISIESTSSNLVQNDLMSGNTQGGVQVSGASATGNQVFGCIIGTDRTGMIALGNGLASQNNGIGVFINGAAGNQVGGDGAGQGNLISGNATAGVYIFGRFAAANVVQGNVIGTDATGLHPLYQNGSTPIQQVGVLISDAPGLDAQETSSGPGNTIGGSAPGAGNLISGNIVGVMLSGTQANGNVVAGNLIGPSRSGGAGAGNTVGVYLNSAPDNTIGGASGNVISGNRSVGVYILGSGSTGNVIAGNLIGLAPNGTSKLPNQTGIYMENAPGNVVGGVSAAAANFVSANSLVGVYILGSQSVGNSVEGNTIGSTARGGRAGNGEYGVLLYNAPTNTVIRSGRNRNRITGSGIANYREFLGAAVSASSSGGSTATHSKSSRSTAKAASSHSRMVIGHATPAGPLRRAPKAK